MTYFHYFQVHPLVCLCGGMGAMKENKGKRHKMSPKDKKV